MAELVERNWAMEEIKFWENRAKYYRDMIFDLMAKMLEGVKFDSVEWTADGITWKEKQSGWIPCNERYPDMDERVLVYTVAHEYHVWDCMSNRADNYFWEDETGLYHDKYEVDLWLPLPEPYDGARMEVEE